jgi:hypothetical protein
MNLALRFGSITDYDTPYQTPTWLTNLALHSKDTTDTYKNYFIEIHGGLNEELVENFSKIDQRITNGYHWIMV